MDNSLVPTANAKLRKELNVLILVVMDNSLVLTIFTLICRQTKQS